MSVSPVLLSRTIDSFLSFLPSPMPFDREWQAWSRKGKGKPVTQPRAGLTTVSWPPFSVGLSFHVRRGGSPEHSSIIEEDINKWLSEWMNTQRVTPKYRHNLDVNYPYIPRPTSSLLILWILKSVSSFTNKLASGAACRVRGLLICPSHFCQHSDLYLLNSKEQTTKRQKCTAYEYPFKKFIWDI